MKTEELKALGLSDEQVRSVFELNGKEIDKQKKRIAELEADLENANKQFEQADETLKKFGDMIRKSLKSTSRRQKMQSPSTKASSHEEISRNGLIRNWTNTE